MRADGAADPADAATDPAGLAAGIVAANDYVTLSTVSGDGLPWATPVWFAPVGLREVVWASKPGARHSMNIAGNPTVAWVIFDSRVEPGQGTALYATGRAVRVEEDDFRGALDSYNARSLDRGLGEWSAERLREPARHRLYRAVADELFVLDDRDERIPVE